jgi:hypothetical protein
MLSWGTTIAKRWRRHAPEQSKVLLAFERAGWPPILVNPLDLPDTAVPAVEVHDTVNSLNDRLAPGTLHFHVVGCTGVGWQPDTGQSAPAAILSFPLTLPPEREAGSPGRGLRA